MIQTQSTLRTNDEDVEAYTMAIKVCLEILCDTKSKPISKGDLKSMARLLAGSMIGIARQVVNNKNLEVTLSDEILNDNG